jgi:hypothetical protein
MMEAVRTSETSVDNHFTRQYIPEDNCEHHTRRRENLKSHKCVIVFLSHFTRMPGLYLEIITQFPDRYVFSSRGRHPISLDAV